MPRTSSTTARASAKQAATSSSSSSSAPVPPPASSIPGPSTSPSKQPSTTTMLAASPASPASKPKTSGRRAKAASRAQAAAAAAAAAAAGASSTSDGHAPSASTSSSSSSTLPWSAVIDADVGNQPVVFSSDGDFYFTTSGSSIRIHSRHTGLVVSTLSSPSSGPTRHTAPVSAIFLNPSNPLQLVSASLDGTVKIWDYLDARLLKSVFVGLPVQYAAMHAKHKDSIFVAVRKPKAQPNGETVDPFNYDGRVNSIIYSVSLATVSNSRGTSNPYLLKPRELLRIGKTRDASGLEISPDGRWMVLIGNRKVQIASLSSSGLRQGFTKFTTDAALTTLAFHPDPDNGTFATGDAQGKIRVWYLLRGEDGKGLESIRMQASGSEKRAPSTLLHWHAHAVSSLRFSPLGSHLLSGGEEGVLVLWQLATQSKEYVPRLGAPIASIDIAGGTESSDGEVVVRLADGSTSFISAASLKVTRSLSGSKIDVTRRQVQPGRLWKMEQPLAIQPGTGHLVVTSSHPSTLQFVDVASDRLIREVEITPSNRVSRPDETPLEPTRVEKVDFFANAKGRAEWMATLDSRRSTQQGRTQVSQHLKFWKWEPKTERYVLNTRVEAPHASSVVSMRFSSRVVDLPTSGAGGEAIVSPLLLTAGLDGQIKVWRLATSSVKGGRTSSYWIVRSSFGYRDSLPSDVAWSPDSSLFAVAQGTFVTVWDTRSNVLRRLVCAPSTAAPRVATSGGGGGGGGSSAGLEENPNESRHIAFSGKGGRFLFMSSSKALCVWDLVLGQMRWERSLDSAKEGFNVRNSRLAKMGDDVLVVSTLESRRTSFGPSQGGAEGGTTSGSGSGALRRSQEAKRTRIQRFDPAEPTPRRVWNLPLALREVRVVDAPSSSRDAQDGTEPSLLAITESHDVVLLGTAFGGGGGGAKARGGAGDQAQSLSGVSIAKRTLFDDIFGPSSSSSAANPDEASSQAAAAGGRERGMSKEGLLGLFDAPSHLLPPLESLFAEFVQHVLPRRRDVVTTAAAEAGADEAGLLEKDEDMVEEDGEAVVERKEREKAVSEMERVGAWDVEELEGLFEAASLEGGIGGEVAANNKTKGSSSTPSKAKKPSSTMMMGSTPVMGGQKLNGAANASTKTQTPTQTPTTEKKSKRDTPRKSPAVTESRGDGGKKRKSLPA